VTLAFLPKGLDGTYRRILKNIEPEYLHDALRVLYCLCYCFKPMRLDEVVEVLAIELTSKPRFVAEQRLRDPTDILTICSSLVSIIAIKSDSQSQVEAVEEGRLAHYSVREYLVSTLATKHTDQKLLS
jgi:hypothetical protein